MESLHIIKGLWNLSNIGAENSDTRIKLERDSLGRVVKEWQDAHWISSRYDEMGEKLRQRAVLVRAFLPAEMKWDRQHKL